MKPVDRKEIGAGALKDNLPIISSKGNCYK